METSNTCDILAAIGLVIMAVIWVWDAMRPPQSVRELLEEFHKQEENKGRND